MRNTLKTVLLTFMICAFYGCWESDWSITLYAQKIEGSSKILYKYDAWGNRDAHESGYAILDSTENFRMSKINKLPIFYLEEIPQKDNIWGVSHESYFASPDKDATAIFTPIKNDQIRGDGIDVHIKIYQYNGFSARREFLNIYEFENFKETRDSILFYNLDETKGADPQHLDTLKFRKINVVIMQTTDNEVNQIDIEDMKISKNKNEIISYKPYFLKPKKTIKSDEFSDYGIFKEKK